MQKKLLVVLTALLAAALIGWGVYTLTADNAPAANEAEVVNQQPQIEQELVTSERGTVVAYEGVTGSTALEILKHLADVETESGEFGEFVIAINNVAASGNQFWAFYVNGAPAAEGAGTYQTSDGEAIEWRLESF